LLLEDGEEERHERIRDGCVPRVGRGLLPHKGRDPVEDFLILSLFVFSKGRPGLPDFKTEAEEDLFQFRPLENGE
jgi:hypothetical protein